MIVYTYALPESVKIIKTKQLSGWTLFIFNI